MKKLHKDLFEPKVIIGGIAVLCVLAIGIYFIVSGGQTKELKSEGPYFGEELPTEDTSYISSNDRKILTAFGLVSPGNISKELVNEILECFHKELDDSDIEEIVETGKVKLLQYEDGKKCIGTM
jgi:hypothetical protein